MKIFKLTISYDGANYHGWQIQPNNITVASVLQGRFKHVFNKSITLIGASRTDSGVHALGQVARVKVDLNISKEKLLRVWNSALPKDIVIRNAEEVDESFHPCANVDYKVYYYHLSLTRPLPFYSRYTLFYKFINQVDLKKFESALRLYIGEHDFASFCKIEDKNKTTIRKIDNIRINKIKHFNVLQIVVVGKSFLRFQIRRMIGYALDVARRKDMSLDYLQSLLDNPNPRQKLLKADGCGLCLRKVVYKDEVNFKK